MSMTKRFLAVVVICGIVLGGMPALRVYGQERYTEIVPFFTHISRASAFLSIDNNGRASMSGTIVGHPGTTQISAEMVLYRVNSDETLTPLHSSGSISTESNVWVWEGVRFVATGHYYRAILYVRIYRSGEVETAVVYSGTVRAN